MRRHLQRWFRKIFRRKRRPVYRPRFEAEEPAAIEPGIIYIIGEQGYQWAIAFKCPCGCGNDV